MVTAHAGFGGDDPAADDTGSSRTWREANSWQSLRTFLRSCVPDLDAAELLLALACAPQQTLALDELLARLHTRDLTQPAARRHLERLEACGVVVRRDGRYRYAPADNGRRLMVQALDELYHRRPVTLVRMIYSARDDGIRAFSDAFRLQRD